MKKLAILGSTGSIGKQTLEVVRAFPERFEVIALAGGKNADLLADQVQEFQPRMVFSPTLQQESKTLIHPLDNRAEVSTMEEMAAHPDTDLVVIATSGKAGLSPTLAALRQGKTIALANKEILVMAGRLVTSEMEQHGAQILPIDSEHSALWQCLQGEPHRVARLILTASGGPFIHRPPEELAKVNAEEALRHPTWTMGPKVTIDSATLMNKGMEVIEAHWLFHMPLDDIQVIIHPQSIIHSMVEFPDGSVKAQLSYPDMRLPIQYALSYPERLEAPVIPRIDFKQAHSLTFEAFDSQAFPCLQLALEAGRKEGTYPAVLCAADEVAVNLFLNGRIGFLDIPRIISTTLEQHQGTSNPSLSDITQADHWAREQAHSIAAGVELQ